MSQVDTPAGTRIPRKRFSIVLLLLSVMLLGTAFAVSYVQKSNPATITWTFNNGHDVSLTFSSATGDTSGVTVNLYALSTKDLSGVSLAVWIQDIPAGVSLYLNGTALGPAPVEIGLFSLLHNQQTRIVGLVTFGQTPPPIGSYSLGAEVDQAS